MSAPGETLALRRAELSDSELLLRWRNDPETRRSSIQTGEVSQAEHDGWFRKSLSSPDREIYVAERGSVPVGTVRLDRREKGWELSWTVAPEFRGRGIGKQLVAAGARLKHGPILARIRASNEPSIRIAEAVGFRREAFDSDGVQSWTYEGGAR